MLYAARICYNSEGWTHPTGEAPKLESNAGYVALFGFGMEEWLFRNKWIRDGWRYAFLQGVNKSLARLNKAQEPFDLLLYALTPEESRGQKRRRLVALIRNAEALTTVEARDTLRHFKAHGWYRTMVEEVKQVGGNLASLKGEISRGMIFNLRYRPENVSTFPADTYAPDDHYLQTYPRYYLTELDQSMQDALPLRKARPVTPRPGKATQDEGPSTYLLTWNPTKFPWDDLERDAETVRAKGYYRCSWSCGNTKRIRKGDRFFLIKLGRGDRGIVGSGEILSSPSRGTYTGGQKDGEEGNFVAVKFTRLTERAEEVFPLLRLKRLAPKQLWTPQASGTEIPAVTARKLEAAWEEFWGGAEERRLRLAVKYMEGALKRAEVNRYERKAGAKADCIRAHGWDCVVCGVNFEARYGSIGRNFIHVHHLEELSQRGKSKATDPAHDLRPVCPNCHAMLHRESPALTVEELKRMLRD